MASSTGEISRLLAAVQAGDLHAGSLLLDLIYGDLHTIARRYMSRERRDHTLQPTALVNETYMRLISDGAIDWQNRAHFFATAAIAMRRILVDYARRRKAGKRFDGSVKVDLSDVIASTSPRIEQLIALDEALCQLAQWGPRQARVVELLYFGGLTETEAAEVLRVSERTIKRDWVAARAWLQGRLSQRSI